MPNVFSFLLPMNSGFIMSSVAVQNEHVQGTLTLLPTHHVRFQGVILSPHLYVARQLIAAKPFGKHMGYSGAGLPWPNVIFAFEDTPNQYSVPVQGAFDVTFLYPNAYYSPDGYTRIPPSIFLLLTRTPGSEPIVVHLPLSEPSPLKMRTLTHRERRYKEGPGFYAAKDVLLDPLPSSAEMVMRTMSQYKEKYDIA